MKGANHSAARAISDKDITLVLEDGTTFKGRSFGAHKPASGEVVFNTGMVGYPETFTDPSYRGQILVLTYPLVGNYGVPGDERDEHRLLRFFESDDIHIRGLIISDYSMDHNHWNSNKSLGDWLKERGIPAIYGIDTRELTKKLRERGVMLGRISIDDSETEAIEDPNLKNLVAEVSIDEPVVYRAGPKKVVMIDCGVKNNIIRSFLKRGVTVIRVPWDHDFSKIDHDGIFISNGPGDPKMCKDTISHLKSALKGSKPIFGICLGNQLLALAAGADTFKLRYGHRSQNQPCIEVGTKRCYITSQNHGFAVNEKTLPADFLPWFVNANDNTNEGIRHESRPIFSVQFHPEATPGPTETEFLFDRFIEAMKKND